MMTRGVPSIEPGDGLRRRLKRLLDAPLRLLARRGIPVAADRHVFHRESSELPLEVAPALDHNRARPPKRFGIVYTTPAQMTMSERVVLYALVFGLRPHRCLEIGTAQGGSALVIGAALDDVGTGHLVSVDRNPMIAPHHWAELRHRATVVKGSSPEALAEAARAAGAGFDLALIDGDHERSGVVRDVEATMPILARGAYLVFHDAHYYGVAKAIDDVLERHPDRLTDCGLVSVEQTPEDRVEAGHPVVWGGLRLLRHHAT